MNAIHVTQEIRELGKTNKGNGEHEIYWNLNVEFNSMRWAEKPEISMTLKQWHKSKDERGKKKKNSENLIYDILNLKIQINSFKTPLTNFYRVIRKCTHTK